MNAVVSLLDPAHCKLVEDLWSELAADFGVRGVYVTPYPHFSYQVAEHYDLPQLEALLAGFARRHAPLRVRSSGLGLFTGRNPVLFIPVIKSPELVQLQHALWQELAPVARRPVGYYEPGRWQPHITLGHTDIDASNLPAIVGALAGREYNWEIRIDNLTVISHLGDRQELGRRFALG